jgi:predicted transcriptional regulator
MAKRKRASARGKPASKKDGARSRKAARKTCEQKSAQRPAGQKTVRGHSIAPKNANVIRRLIFTPAALAYARHRYEKTEASLVDIAVDLQVTKNTVRNLAKSEGWTRYVPPARNLPPGVQLMVQAGNVEAQTSSIVAARSPVFADTARVGEDAIQSKSKLPNINGAAMAKLSDTVGRLYRAVLKELASVENLRAQLKREPKSPQDAERTARTLSSLTETLQKLQRLQCAVPQSGSHDDDIPADIDEFRTELARRVEAFVASRSDQGTCGGTVAASVDPAAG